MRAGNSSAQQQRPAVSVPARHDLQLAQVGDRTREVIGQMLDPSVPGYLATLTDRTRTVLGSDLVGVYAAGSLALNAYEHGRSDIDIAVVCRAGITLPTKRAFVDALRHESLPCPARGLELVVYRKDVAAAGTSDPGFEVELNTGPRMDFRATYAGADRQEQDGTFWYAIDRSILAERGRVLIGPPATELFRSVPEATLVDLLISSLRWHLGGEVDGESDEVNDGDDDAASWTDDAVLNACRAWRRVRTGHWFSKIDAGQQVLANRHPEATGPAAGDEVLDHTVVEQSLAARSGGTPPNVRQARQFQREILAALQGIAGH